MWKDICWKETLEHEGEPLLDLSITLPAPPEDCRSLRRAGRYYAKMAEVWKDRWRSILFPRARMALEEARAGSRPFQRWEAELSYRITLESEGIISILVDAVERRGGQLPLMVRHADTWDRKTGLPRFLSSLFPAGARWRRPLETELRRQAVQRLESGEFLLFSDAEAKISTLFSPDRFYLSGGDLVLFYPMCSLGSPAEGVVSFSVPLSDFTSQLPRRKKKKGERKENPTPDKNSSLQQKTE